MTVKSKSKYVLRIFMWFSLAVLIFISIGFATKERDLMVCENVTIHITNQYDNYFIDEEDLMDIISKDGNLSIVGNYMENLNLKTLEKNLEEEKFIKNAQVYKDLRGNIVIKAEQRRPMARIVRPDGPDAYIDEEGEILPLSEKFTSRVMLISGDYTKSFIENGMAEDNKRYMDIIRKISSDPFWKAQISQLDIDNNGEIIIYPQVSKQTVEFGLPDNVETKFNKMELFFKKILPFKGWNTYSRVNIKYQNQIICE